MTNLKAGVTMTRKKRRAALRMKRMMFAFRIMSTSAIARANELLVLRHHDGSYQKRLCGGRRFVWDLGNEADRFPSPKE